jgi:hypothetical protein
MWVCFQVIQAVGAGVVIPTLLPAIQAPLQDSDNALATSTWAFLRSFGMAWGVAISAAIFNNRANQLARSGMVSDPAVASLMSGGDTYQYSNALFMETLNAATRVEVAELLNSSVRLTWYVGIAFSAAGFFLVFLMKSVPLRKELDTEFGLEDKEHGKTRRTIE